MTFTLAVVPECIYGGYGLVRDMYYGNKRAIPIWYMPHTTGRLIPIWYMPCATGRAIPICYMPHNTGRAIPIWYMPRATVNPCLKPMDFVVASQYF